MPMALEVGIGYYGEEMDDPAKKQVHPETGGSGPIHLIVSGENVEVGFVSFPGGTLYDRGDAPLLARWLDQPEPIEIIGLTVGKRVVYPLPLRNSGGNQLALIIERTA